jgi:hypothetical protein
MIEGSRHFNIHPEVENITAPYCGNAITKEYYWFLVGEINRGTMKKAVCRIENHTFGTESYYLISC